MRPFIRFSVFALLLFTIPAFAQTYTPKTIRIDAPDSVDKTEALRIANLPSSRPLTKDQIEAALGRLSDTGMFADLSYTVDGNALTIKLTPSAASQLQPVVFANFVWWQPAELESLIEQRVPAYHGKLPAAGTLTQQVEDALVALLHDKGVDARIEARETGMGAASVTLSIASPRVLVGKVDIANSLPALEKHIAGFTISLEGEDFDLGVATKSIHDSVSDIYQNNGYLDITVAAPTYGAPQKQADHYSVDLTDSVNPGPIYHVAQITIQAAPPVSEADLAKAAAIKAGDPASPLAQRVAAGEMQKTYSEAGYLAADVHFAISKDSNAHTVSYAVTTQPGEVFHLAGVDASALPPGNQAAFKQTFHVAPGTVADRNLLLAVHQALLDAHIGLTTIQMRSDNQAHTVVYVLKPR